MYMLDTNICIYIIRKRPDRVLEQFERCSSQQIAISVVTLAELQYGVERSSAKELNQRIVDEFAARLEVLPWDEWAARAYGRIRRGLEEKGTPIGNMDLLIAAHALSQDLTLVSNNLREFRRVPQLMTENWTR